mmetsp:Transcript_18957/g.26758  ORF Transcript_18957/g.26758 Transcript_18957/m.26758 type:complete len:286 (-) Transcript_18957:230-1087(-)
MLHSTRLFVLLGLICPTVAFSRSLPFTKLQHGQYKKNNQVTNLNAMGGATTLLTTTNSNLFRFRGGQQQEEEQVVTEKEPKASPKASLLSAALALPAGGLTSFGKFYATSLESSPIATKSVTAGTIFALSDFAAQRLESRGGQNDDDKTQMDWKRTIASGLVGLLYFGPAAHAWYGMIFKILPGTSLISTLQKATLGQMLFGPSFTCIFFAVALLQSGSFTLGNWVTKIRQDLPGAWLAGCGFWPLVDIISYSFLDPQWIPLFINTCSFVWTIYLSLVSNRSKSE